MQLNSLDFFFRSFAEEQMNFLYTGDFSDELTDRLIDLNNSQHNSVGNFKVLQRKAGFLIAECFQNIVRHSDLTNQNGYFHIKNNKGTLNIISGNTVEKNLVPTLKGQLDQLNKLTSKELKEIYRKTLFDGKVSAKGGAGLGLIEMARKTNNKLSFSFSDFNELKAYFYFQLQLNIEEFTQCPINNNFDTSILLRDKMLKDDLFLVYKGIISTQITVAILGIIEKTFKSLDQKVVFVKLMEFFEKISGQQLPSEKENSCMLFIGETSIEYNIGSTCFLKNKEASSLQRTLTVYKSYSKELLDNEYNRLLKEGSEIKNREYNLYLIDLIRNCTSLNLNVRSYSDELSYVSWVLGFVKKRRSAPTLLVKDQQEIELEHFATN